MIKRQVQSILHDPSNGRWGDRNRTCLAMMLGLDRDDVPHENREITGEEQNKLVRDWLAARGLGMACVGYNMDLDWVKQAMGVWSPGVTYMLAGRSPRGTQHIVVMRPDGVMLDPHPDDTGLVGPDSEGTWWVYFITALPGAEREAANQNTPTPKDKSA